jgi:hypothetical protein
VIARPLCCTHTHVAHDAWHAPLHSQPCMIAGAPNGTSWDPAPPNEPCGNAGLLCCAACCVHAGDAPAKGGKRKAGTAGGAAKKGKKGKKGKK